MPYKDKEQQKRYQAERQARRRAEWFSDKVCSFCGSDDRLELDHIDPTEKTSHRIWSWSEVRLQSELAKCQPLCYACHKAKTKAFKENLTHGSAAMYRNGCRCDDCREYSRQTKARWRAKQ